MTCRLVGLLRGVTMLKQRAIVSKKPLFGTPCEVIAMLRRSCTSAANVRRVFHARRRLVWHRMPASSGMGAVPAPGGGDQGDLPNACHLEASST